MLRNFLKDSKEKTPPLAFHTMTMCENVICIYGGMTAKDEVSGDVYFIKLNGKNIIKAEYEKNKALFPKPRHSHSADYDISSKRLFIFGGHCLEHPNFLNQLCVLDLKNFPTIVFQSIKSIDITSRCMHTTFLTNGKLYIYGGYGMVKNTNEIKILNDFFYLEISTGKIAEVTSKGGNEMINKLYKAIPLERNDEIAFITQNLSSFQVFNLETEVFTKIEIKFEVPQIREYFTINLLQDGRLIIFGGCRNDDSFRDIYYLINYTYDQKVFWMWSRMDILGDVHEGYSGHCSLVLENNHILIHGGTERAFDWRSPESTKHEAGFSNRVQLFDIYSSYEWLQEIKTDFDNTSQNMRSINSDSQNRDNEKLSLRNTLPNTVLHIMAYIPKDAEDYHAKMLIHGGEREDQIICRHHIYNLTESRWIGLTYEEEENFCPQLKGHAWSNYYITMGKRKEHYIIVTGGITIEHVGGGCKVALNEKMEKIITNSLKQSCPCTNEDISAGVFAYRNNFWNKVKVLGENVNDHLKRYGHSMAYIPEKDSLYMICGFIQYKGYVVQLTKLEIKKEDDFFKKKKKNLESTKIIELECKFTEISLDDYNIKGRMHATLGVAGCNLILFGGIRDDCLLNDMYVITLNNESNTKPNVILVQNDPKIILPRFGMSSVIYTDEFNRDISRLLVFGGSLHYGEKMVAAMTNELIVFQFRFNPLDNSINIESLIPTVYGFSEKRLFHSAVVHDGNMYIYGGLNTRFQIMNIPNDVSYNIESTLNEYITSFPAFTFDDWEMGNTSKNKEMKRKARVAENIGNNKEKDKESNFTRNNNDERSFANKSIINDNMSKSSFFSPNTKIRPSIIKSLNSNPNSNKGNRNTNVKPFPLEEEETIALKGSPSKIKEEASLNSKVKKKGNGFSNAVEEEVPKAFSKLNRDNNLNSFSNAFPNNNRERDRDDIREKDENSIMTNTKKSILTANRNKEGASFKSKIKRVNSNSSSINISNNKTNSILAKSKDKESLNSSIDNSSSHTITNTNNNTNANATTNQNVSINDNSINILLDKDNSIAEDNALINIVSKHRKASHIFIQDEDKDEYNAFGFANNKDNNPNKKVSSGSLIRNINDVEIESRNDNLSKNNNPNANANNPLNLLNAFTAPKKIMDVTVDSVSRSNISSSVISKKGFNIKKRNKSGNNNNNNIPDGKGKKPNSNWDQDYD
jgi:hypothetical protein